MRTIGSILIVLSMLMASEIVLAKDFSKMATEEQKHNHWMSIFIANPMMKGQVFATRAGTEDKRTNSSLALTYAIEKKCVLSDTAIIIKTNYRGNRIKPVSRFVTFQIDNSSPKTFKAILQRDGDTKFTFLSIYDEKLDQYLIEGNNLMIDCKGIGIQNFSLSGSRAAIERASSECRNYLID